MQQTAPNKMRYRKSLLLLIPAFAFLAAACQSQDTATSGKVPIDSKNVLRMDISASFSTLDPYKEPTGGSTLVFPFLYSFLCVPDMSGKLRSDLATRWQYDPQTFTWTVTLRSDAKFHDGTPVTAEDACYSIRRAKNINPGLYGHVMELKPVSDLTFSMRLACHDPQYLEKIWITEILPRNADAQIDYYNAPIGSGPFRFSHRQGQKRIFLEANPAFYEGPPSLDGVMLTYQPNQEAIWTRLLAHKTDVSEDVPPKAYEKLKPYKDRFYFNTDICNRFTIMLYNTQDPLFSDKRVRRAMTHAIDRQYIVNHFCEGMAKMAVGPMGIDSVFQNPAVEPMEYDPETAIRLLQLAGWHYHPDNQYLSKEGRPFEFTLLVNNEYKIDKQIAHFIKLCLNDIGIRMHIRTLPIGSLASRYQQNDEFQAVLTELTAGQHEPEYLQYFWSPMYSDCSEAGCFRHPEVTRLLKQSAATANFEQKKSILRRVDALIRDLQPGTFLFHRVFVSAMSKRFELRHPFETSYQGLYNLRHAKLSGNYKIGN